MTVSLCTTALCIINHADFPSIAPLRSGRAEDIELFAPQRLLFPPKHKEPQEPHCSLSQRSLEKARRWVAGPHLGLAMGFIWPT